MSEYTKKQKLPKQDNDFYRRLFEDQRANPKEYAGKTPAEKIQFFLSKEKDRNSGSGKKSKLPIIDIGAISKAINRGDEEQIRDAIKKNPKLTEKLEQFHQNPADESEGRDR